MTPQPQSSSLILADIRPAPGDETQWPVDATESLCIFTIVARNYLPLAYTLADSVRLHHPDAKLHIFVVDGTQGLPEPPRHALTSLDEILDASFDAMRFKYSITEFCTSVKPHLFQRLLAETSAQFIFYLDPDTWLFTRLDLVHDAAPKASIYLTPHLLLCDPSRDHAYPEYKHLWEGIFNLGFCAVRRSQSTDLFLKWWDAQLSKYCYADHFDGLHTDQKWMDYVPVYFGADLHIVRHPGVNVAHWNLDERHLEGCTRTGWRVDGHDLALFHFSGFDFRSGALTRHTGAQLQARYASNSLQELASKYRQDVLANGYDSHIGIAYGHGRFDNGNPITVLHRRLFRALGDSSYDAAPFSTAGRLYQALLGHGLLDSSPAAARSHAAATLPTLGRLTRIAHTALRVFLKLAGPSRYAYLLKFFSRYARPENHVFLIEAELPRPVDQ